MESGVSLSDIAAVTKDGGQCFGGGAGIWIFALLILLGMGNGFGFGGGTQERVATQADIQRAVDFDTLKSSIANGTASTITAIKDSAYNNLSEIRDNGMAMATGFANMQNCCCELKQQVMENRYLAAQNTAQITAKLDQNKIESLQAQVNQLQLSQAMCGVPKISTNAWGVYPYNGYQQAGCGCGNI